MIVCGPAKALDSTSGGAVVTDGDHRGNATHLARVDSDPRPAGRAHGGHWLLVRAAGNGHKMAGLPEPEGEAEVRIRLREELFAHSERSARRLDRHEEVRLTAALVGLLSPDQGGVSPAVDAQRDRRGATSGGHGDEGTTHSAAFHHRGHDRRLHLILLLEHQQPLTAFVDSDPLRQGSTGDEPPRRHR